jgi:hypothetical protein
MTHRPVAEHPLQNQIADALRLEIAPPANQTCSLVADDH